MTIAAQSPLDDTTRRRAMQSPAATGLRAWLTRLTEPHILFPALTILVLGVIWSATVNLIKVERANSVAASAATALASVETDNAKALAVLIPLVGDTGSGKVCSR